MNTEVPKIKLWQQYEPNKTVKSLFVFLREHIQKKYFDILFKKESLGSFTKELSIVNAATDFLEFYAKNILGIYRPFFISDYQEWDRNSKWDEGNLWDTAALGEKIPIDIFKKLLLFAYNWKYPVWNIETLIRLTADFIECPFSKVNIEFSNKYSHMINIILPLEYEQNYYANAFYILVSTYPKLFNFPLGYTVGLVFNDTKSNKTEEIKIGYAIS